MAKRKAKPRDEVKTFGKLEVISRNKRAPIVPLAVAELFESHIGGMVKVRAQDLYDGQKKIGRLVVIPAIRYVVPVEDDQ